MAIIDRGILGGFKGTIGPVTGYMRNGQNIMRSSSSAVRYKRTPLRSIQLEKIKLCNGFTHAFSRTGFFSKTFPAYGGKGSGYNRAASALMNLAIISSGGALQLSYPDVLVSKGLLPKAEGAATALLANGEIQFSFTDNSGTGTAAADDAVILVAYCEALQQAAFILNAGFRKDGLAVLNAACFKGYTVETWIGFLSNNGVHASDSVWAGQLAL